MTDQVQRQKKSGEVYGYIHVVSDKPHLTVCRIKLNPSFEWKRSPLTKVTCPRCGNEYKKSYVPLEDRETI